jgi:hypothetical protein
MFLVRAVMSMGDDDLTDAIDRIITDRLYCVRIVDEPDSGDDILEGLA